MVKAPLKESETVELRQTAVDESKNEIIAFANRGGGALYVGMADSGEVIGLADAGIDLTI